MSLLLDALQRASKDKEKAAVAAAHAAAAESLSEGKFVLAAADTPAANFPDLALAPVVPSTPPKFVEDVPLAIVLEPPVTAQVQETAPQVAQAPAMPTTLALEMQLEERPAHSQPQRVEPALQAVPTPEPEPTKPPAVSFAKDTNSTSQYQSVAAMADSPVAPQPAKNPAKPLSPQAAAAALQNAYAGPVFARARTTNHRPALLAGIAAILGLAFASFALGLWGDPEKLLGQGGVSSIAQVDPAQAAAPVAEAVPLPDTGSAQPLPALSSSAPLPVQVESAPTQAVQGVPVSPALPTIQAQPSPPPLPKPQVAPLPAVAVAAASAPAARPAELVLRAATLPNASSAGPVFAARARSQSALELGYAALLSGRLEDARKAYASALNTNSEEPDALLGLAYIAHTQGRRDEAQDYYRRVVRQDPGNSVANAGLLALEVGASGASNAAATGASAGERAKALAARQPDSAAVQALAANALVQEGALPDAALAFARAQALEPANPLYAYNLAVALDKLGNYAQAAAQYDTAVRTSAAAATPLGAAQLGAARLRAAQLRQSLGQVQQGAP